jgi:UDP-GlcNAc:undecaprenyl-phosphate GlcNAc-1-phosphate transferase
LKLIFEEIINEPNVQIFLSIVLSLGITWRSIPVIRNICMLRGLMENPVKRSSHDSPTPTFGGIAIFAGTMIGYMVWNFKDEGFLLHKVFAGLLILFFLGLKDDLYALAPLKKIISQIVASLIVIVGSDLRIYGFFGIFGVHELPYLVSILFTLFVFVALINSFNLIDGIDGLSGGIGMIASSGFGWWFLINEHWSLACLSLSLSASLLGFLRYNYSKESKIFMGDTGSLIVGYLITILAVKFISLNQNYNFSPGNHFVSAPVLALSLLSVPIFDTMRVFGVRLLKGKSPFLADRIHLHHLLVDNGLSHLAASLTLYCMTIIISVFTYSLLTFFTNTALSIYVISVFGIYLAFSKWLEIRRFKNHRQKLNQTSTSLENDFDLKSSVSQN